MQHQRLVIVPTRGAQRLPHLGRLSLVVFIAFASAWAIFAFHK